MSTILGATPPSLPASPALHLLPFNLHPLPASAPIKDFFQPRPAPPNHAVAEGTQLAAFRGRQVVGHTISVPRGYRGIVLHAPPAIVSSGTTPLTPASSTASVTTATTAPASRTRARGTGQVALSRPKAVRSRVPLKRIRIETHDDDDDDEVDERARRAAKRAAKTRTPSPMPAEGVPRIEVVGATPPRVVVTGVAEVEEVVAEVVEGGVEIVAEAVVKTETVAETVAETVVETVVETAVETVVETAVETVAETVVEAKVEVEPTAEELAPAPSAIRVPLIASASLAEVEDQLEDTHDDEGGVRVLRPVAAFDEFTLWTPDVAMPGCDAGEGDAGEGEAKGGERDRWWRTGGGGEGGDEFVRALGEWLGLGEVIHVPLYGDCDSDDE